MKFRDNLLNCVSWTIFHKVNAMLILLFKSISLEMDDKIYDLVQTLLQKGEDLKLEERKDLIARANEIFEENVRLSKEKLQLSTNAYEMVENISFVYLFIQLLFNV